MLLTAWEWLLVCVSCHPDHPRISFQIPGNENGVGNGFSGRITVAVYYFQFYDDFCTPFALQQASMWLCTEVGFGLRKDDPLTIRQLLTDIHDKSNDVDVTAFSDP